ncbi:MAG: hypothetical protein KDC13_04355 [Bacteroidetes bacterium]|nr:hypothetical protein [Bacteroidota bacterium]
MKAFLTTALFVSLCFVARAGESRDTLQFEAEDAIRYAKFVDFHRFGEEWTASPDSSGKYWIVKAMRQYNSKKIIKNTGEGLSYCDEDKGCKVESYRIMKMDKFSGKIVDRRKYLKISSN